MSVRRAVARHRMAQQTGPNELWLTAKRSFFFGINIPWMHSALRFDVASVARDFDVIASTNSSRAGLLFVNGFAAWTIFLVRVDLQNSMIGQLSKRAGDLPPLVARDGATLTDTHLNR